MKVVSVTGPREALLVERPDPQPRGEFVVVRVQVAPTCTEYKGWNEGWISDCLGHEAAGIVDATDGQRRVREGDRVLVLPQYPCGACDLCRQGEYVFCESSVNPLTASGNTSGVATYAQLLIKQDWMLVPVPDDISLEHASLANCALGPAYGAYRRVRLTAEDTVLVTGLGPVGLGAVILARRLGRRVVATDPSAYRRELALALGADAVFDAAEPDALQQVREAGNGRGVDVAVECSGHPAGQRFAIDALRRRGRMAFIAEAGDLTIRVSQDLLRKGLEIHGCWNYNLADTLPLFRMIRTIGPELDQLITHRFPMSRVEDAFALQAEGRTGKVLLDPWG